MTVPLSLSNVGTGYGRGRPVLRDVTLTVSSGSIMGLLGRNGAGKTTLIHTALGLRKPWHGRVALSGGKSRRTMRRGDAGRAPPWRPVAAFFR